MHVARTHEHKKCPHVNQEAQVGAPKAYYDGKLRTLWNLRMASSDCSMIKRAVKEELLKPRYRDVTVATVIDEVLSVHGLEAQMCNSMYEHYLCARDGAAGLAAGIPPHRPLPANGTQATAADDGGDHPPQRDSRHAPQRGAELDTVVAMRKQWGGMLLNSLRWLCEEMGQPLIKMRPDGGPYEGQPRHWRGKRVQQKGRHLYEADDVLEAIVEARHPNDPGARGLTWSITPLYLRTATLAGLQVRFAELAPSVRHTGVDDELRGWFEEARLAEGGRLMQHGYAPLLTEFAKRGVPTGLRGRFWLGMLRIGVGEREYNYYAGLVNEMQRLHLVTDDLQRRDAASPFLQSEYFVFESTVEEVLLCFSRDPRVYQQSAHLPHSTVLARNRPGTAKVPFPPSGVPPFRGQCQFIFPLCYAYPQPQELYFVHRALWTRYWSR